MTGNSDTTARNLTANVTVRRDSDFVLDVDLELQAGKTTALLGPNGSGKSTFVAAVAGLVPIDSGMISLGSRVLDDPSSGVFVAPELREAGVVFQKYLLFEHLDVLDNISFAASTRGVAKAEARSQAQAWVDSFELGGLETRRPSQLSGGQAQRVAVARALAAKPAMLLLDEPLAALDVETRGVLRRLLRRHLEQYEGPRLLITHDPVDAFLLADSVVIIENGRVTQQGPPEQIAQRPATPYAAALAGLNLLVGTNSGGVVALSDSELSLATSDTQTSGSVIVTIAPNAIALHATEPHGSPRNSWETSVATIENSGDIVRITLGGPLSLNVDITPGAAKSMELAPGHQVWASVKATEVFVNPA